MCWNSTLVIAAATFARCGIRSLPYISILKLHPMASAVISRRSRSLCCAVNAADRNKTITSCLILGEFFSADTRFFRSFKEEIDAAFDVRMMIFGGKKTSGQSGGGGGGREAERRGTT